MEILRWEDSLRVGVLQIDNEHRLICAMMNDLVKVAEAGQSVQSQMLNQSLTALFDAIRRHFSSEEQLLAEAGYPDCAGHQQLHRTLEAKLEQMLTNRGLAVNAELIEFLRHWFLDHLQAEDQKYALFLKSR